MTRSTLLKLLVLTSMLEEGRFVAGRVLGKTRTSLVSTFLWKFDDSLMKPGADDNAKAAGAWSVIQRLTG